MRSFRYILLPSRGFKSPEMVSLGPKKVGGKKAGGMAPFSAKVPGGPAITVVDSIDADGPKAVDMTPDEARAFRRDQLLRLVPVRKYRTARAPTQQISLKSLANLFTSNTKIQLKVIVKEAGTDRPLKDAGLVAIVDPLTGAGIRRRTGVQGQATLTLPNNKPITKLFVYPPPGYWGKYLVNPKLADVSNIFLTRLDPSFIDFLRTAYETPRPKSSGKQVRVAVIDTGVDRTHPDLAGVKCFNFVTGEQPDDLGPSDGHGTHVAGIIAGSKHGLAPAVEIYSYKVFPHSGSADNWDISQAINQAVKDKCDLINLSLGGVQQDALLGEAIGEAFEHGSVSIVAAGNAHRRPVAYPAWFKRSLAVSAIGRLGSFPADAVEMGEVSIDRSSTDKSIFFASFSNWGREIDFCAPGVGIVSTWLDKGYAVENGTSMACPIVTGVAAALLSSNPAVLSSMGRNSARSWAIVQMIQQACEPVGLTQAMEGFGRPML
jgi:subtilisin